MSENIVSHSSWKNLLTRLRKFTLMWTKLLSGKWNAQGPHSHILMMGGGTTTEVHFYTPKNPNFRICLPKKIPQCFCISKFYYLSSGKLKHANFNFGFGQKQNYKLRLCYCWFELMKNTIPKKIPVLFSRPKKIPASFIDPKKSLLAKMSDPKKSFGPPPPSLKFVSGARGVEWLLTSECVFNPFNPDISIFPPPWLSFPFPKVLMKRISLTIKTLSNSPSFFIYSQDP